MTKEVLLERIRKNEETIQKKKDLIIKREKAIAKKEEQLEKSGFGGMTLKEIASCEPSVIRNGAYWTRCDVENYKKLNRDAERAIEEIENMLIKYRNQLQVEIQKEESINNLPQIFTKFQNMLITKWDEFDIKRRDKIKACLKELHSFKNREEYKKYRNELLDSFGFNLEEKAAQTNEQIHKNNVKDSRNIILDLINRVSAKTGEIIDFSGLEISSDNQGFSILNGTVKGKNGIATVESILAGGYNIQRLHVRVLVK